MVDGGVGVELASVNRLLQRAQVYDRVILGEDVVEAALRQTHVERHLATLEAVDRDARTCLRTLLAAPCGLALARADTTADAHPALAGTGIVIEFVKLGHCALAFAMFARIPTAGIDQGSADSASAEKRKPLPQAGEATKLESAQQALVAVVRALSKHCASPYPLPLRLAANAARLRILSRLRERSVA